MFDNTTEALQNFSENGTENTASAFIYSGVIIIPMILIAVVGNSLTILCFIRDKGLHKTCNIYIINLAVCDLLIGAITMPIYLTYTFNDNVWLLGYNFCKVFLVFDFVTTGVTVVLMILISYDRLLLLKHWTTYQETQTRRRACVKCALSWIYLFVINFPATVGWDLWTKQNNTYLNNCDAPYLENEIYIIVMTCVQFIIPIVILSAIHTAIVREIQQLIRVREQLGCYSARFGSQDSATAVIHIELKSSRKPLHITENLNGHVRTRRGTKAAKSLGILTFVFFVTWAPYAVVLVVQSICSDCIGVDLIETCTWILWFKSTINPFLYAFNSNRFRENFKFFLCFMRRGYRPATSSF